MSLLRSVATVLGGAAVRVVFLGGVLAAPPAERQQRPKQHHTGNDEQSKPPAAPRRVRVDPPDTHQDERNGEYQSAQEMNSGREEQDVGDHEVTAFAM